MVSIQKYFEIRGWGVNPEPACSSRVPLAMFGFSFSLSFQIGSHQIAQAGLELSMVLNLGSLCLSFQTSLDDKPGGLMPD